jgi:DNA-binding LacI/PurR family transcriptional regulator
MDSTRAAPRPTMAQIAERAGTTVPTVSKVLNGGTDVSEATRARVMAAAHALDYRRRPRARPADRDPRAARVVDVVVGHIEGSWVGPVLSAIEEEASAAGVDLVLTRARPDGEWISRLLRRPSIGAILVLVDATPAGLHALTTAGVPVVAIDPSTRPPAEVASVGATNWDGGRIAAELLIAEGHTRIGVIGGVEAHLFGSARIDGLRTALRSAGIAVPDDRVVYCDWDRERARTAAGALLAAPDRPTAIFACSDVMGLGVYEAADDAGLRIPDDLSVVGFDGVQESAWAMPPMTTVRQPIAEMGATAFHMLQQADRSGRARAGGPAGSRMELETELVRRGSVAAPRG